MSLPAHLFSTEQIHLERLIAEGAQEGPHIDFKRDLPSAWNNDAKNEFLADITAFANSSGGDLIYGIDEGAVADATNLVPQAIDPDQDVRRLQDFLLTLVDPRIPGVQVHAVPVTKNGTSGHVVIVRAPQSWAGPHRVRGNGRFYIRENMRKRDLDVPEIRGLFLRAEAQAQRIRNFRTERLGKILVGELPYKLVDGPVLVVHIVSTQAALGLMQVDPTQYQGMRRLPILGAIGNISLINLDGALAARNPDAAGASHGYTQFFRNGILEATQVLTRTEEAQRATLRSATYELQLFQFLQAVRDEMTLLGVTNELAVMLSLLRADQARLGVTNRDIDDPKGYFDRETIVLPDVLTQPNMTPVLALKPVFDFMWQSAGFPCSRNFNSDGQWAPVI